MLYSTMPAVAAALFSFATGLIPGGSSNCPTCGASRPDTLAIVPSASTLQWRGNANDAGDDRVAGRLAGGALVMQNGRLTGGTFTMDLSAPGSSVATVVITRADQTSDGRFRVVGDLTAHGATRPIEFATTLRWADAGHLVASADLSVDRGALADVSSGAGPTRGAPETNGVLRMVLDARRGAAKTVSERPR